MLLMWIFLLVVAVLAIYLKQKRAPAHPQPPEYPGAWPIIGHTHLLSSDGKKIWALFKDISSCSLKEGGLIIGQLGMDYYYVLTDPVDALTVANTCLRKNHPVYNYLAKMFGFGLLTTSDEQMWKRHRRGLTPAFNLKNIHSFICNFNSQSRKLVFKMDDFTGKGPVDLKKCLEEVVMESALTSIFGNKLTEKQQPYLKYSEATNIYMKMVFDRFAKFWLHFDSIYKLLGYEKQVDKLKADTNEILEKALEVKKANEGSISTLMLDDRYRTFLEMFLQAPGTSTFTDEEMKAEVNNTIGAAYETSTNQSLFTLFYIACHPEVQERIYQEIIEVIGDERDIEKEDLPNLKYTEAVIKETLRVLPTTPIVPRYIDREVKLSNYTLLPGRYCLISLYALNHHPAWIDPYQFRPERWLQPESLPANSNHFASFSLGKRNCIGKVYAMTSIIVLVAHVVRAYRLTADIDKLKCTFDFTLKPAEGCEIAIQRRNK